MGVDHVGPIDHSNQYIFTVDGYKVPNLVGYLIDGEHMWSLVLDERFRLDVPDEELQRWLRFFANGMAIGAGYSCFGENAVPMNPYKTRVGMIGRDVEITDDSADGA